MAKQPHGLLVNLQGGKEKTTQGWASISPKVNSAPWQLPGQQRGPAPSLHMALPLG